MTDETNEDVDAGSPAEAREGGDATAVEDAIDVTDVPSSTEAAPGSNEGRAPGDEPASAAGSTSLGPRTTESAVEVAPTGVRRTNRTTRATTRRVEESTDTDTEEVVEETFPVNMIAPYASVNPAKHPLPVG